MGKKSGGVMPVSSMERDWRAESDLSTLARAEEIKKDPKRYKAALAMAKAKMEEMKSVQMEAIENDATKK